MSVLFWINQIFFWAAALAFNHSMEKRENFYKRCGIFLSIVFCITFLYYYYIWTRDLQTDYLFCIVMYGLMWIFEYMGWKSTKTVALYNAMWSIAVWHVVTECWIIFFTSWDRPPYQDFWYGVLALILSYVILYAIVANTLAKWMFVDRKFSLGPRQILSALLLFGIVDMLAHSPEFHNITEYHDEWRFLFVCQILCIIIMYMQNEFFKRQAMGEELAMMEMLLKKEQNQYQMTKENIALINQKCHDMKHQIRALRNVEKEERDKYLDELEDTVHIYENMVKTGNEVLDTILTDKSLYCMSREIQISCVADGSQMEFINAIDLYSILGNAIDNAIEAVEQFRNPDKRQIDVLIYRMQKFLVINIINPIEKKLVFEGEDEVPVTTKKDRRYHGFGLRSIKYLIGKYDGHLTINEEDGCFSLKMLIPIPEKNSNIS